MKFQRINWFPGHMRRARRQILDTLPSIDLIIEVVDARLPWSSENPLIAELREGKPTLKVLNKVDLADPKATACWVDHLQQDMNTRVLTVRKDRRTSKSNLIQTALSMLPGGDSANSKFFSVQAMIVGVPNVGKSTLINTLTGRSNARMGNTPNITRGQQRIRLNDNIMLIDTPGFLWPRLDPVECGYRLAVSGSISDRVTNFMNLASFAAVHMLERYPGLLRERFGDGMAAMETGAGPEEILSAVARRRGCLMRGGGPDLVRASELFIHELRLGRLGRVSFELPSDIVVVENASSRAAERRRQRRWT